MTREHEPIQSIAELYREFQLPIFRYLYTLTGSQAMAEELTQETFYQAVISVYRFKGNSKVSTWLYTIARNVHANHTRRAIKTRKLNDELSFQLQDDVSHKRGQPELALEQKWMGDKVKRILQSLPEQYRTVILLKEVEGLSHATIAEILNKTVPTTKVLLYRAKRRFQEEYKRLGDNDE